VARAAVKKPARLALQHPLGASEELDACTHACSIADLQPPEVPSHGTQTQRIGEQGWGIEMDGSINHAPRRWALHWARTHDGCCESNRGRHGCFGQRFARYRHGTHRDRARPASTSASTALTPKEKERLGNDDENERAHEKVKLVYISNELQRRRREHGGDKRLRRNKGRRVPFTANYQLPIY
jgi:hypothetical protein